VCKCADSYVGADCAVKTECTFWDEEELEYSSRGCVASPPPSGAPDGFLHCLCNHLTDFSVFRFPSSLADLLAELAAITFNTFSAEDALHFFTSFNPSENPTILKYVGSILGLWLFSLAFARFRLHRRMLNSARTARKQRQQRRNELIAKGKAIPNTVQAELSGGAPWTSGKTSGKLRAGNLSKRGVTQSEADVSCGLTAQTSEACLGGGFAQGSANARMPLYSAYNSEDVIDAFTKRTMLSRDGEHSKSVQTLHTLLQSATSQLQATPPMLHERIPVLGTSAEAISELSAAGAAPSGWGLARRPSNAGGKSSSSCKDMAGPDSPRMQSRIFAERPPEDDDWAPAPRPLHRVSLSGYPARPDQDGDGPSALAPLRRASWPACRAPNPAASPARPPQDSEWAPAPRPLRSPPSLPTSPPQSPYTSPDGQRLQVPFTARPDASAAVAAMLRKPAQKAAPPSIADSIKKKLAQPAPAPSAPSESSGAPEALASNIAALLKKPAPLAAATGAASEEPTPRTVSRWRLAKELTEIQGGKATLADVTQVIQLKQKASRLSKARAKASAAARAQLDAAKASAAEAGEHWRLLRRGQFKTLLFKITGKLRRYVGRLWHTARGEHTLVSFMWPADVKIVLYDTQAVQIFWNVIVLESVLLAMLFSNLPSDVQPGIITLIIQAAISVGPCVVCAIVLRLLFRIGNKSLRRRAKRERGHVKAKDTGISNADAYAKWKKERFTRKRTSSERFAYAKFVAAWTLVIAMFVACVLILMIYAMTFGEQKMQSFLLSIVLSLFGDFFVIEPIEILLVVSLPFLLDNSCITSVKNGAKDLGIL